MLTGVLAFFHFCQEKANTIVCHMELWQCVPHLCLASCHCWHKRNMKIPPLDHAVDSTLGKQGLSGKVFPLYSKTFTLSSMCTMQRHALGNILTCLPWVLLLEVLVQKPLEAPLTLCSQSGEAPSLSREALCPCDPHT